MTDTRCKCCGIDKLADTPQARRAAAGTAKGGCPKCDLDCPVHPCNRGVDLRSAASSMG